MVWLLSFFLFSNISLSAPGGAVKFEKAKLKINNKTISVEIAESEAQHQQGLMHRTSLPENHGMLFIFSNEEFRSFWMKNTLIDLSIGFFDKNRKLVDVQEMQATSILEKSPPSYFSKAPATYALEMNQGWFRKNKIKVGDVFELDRSLAQPSKGSSKKQTK